MLYLLGGGADRAALPQYVETAVAKVNPIETFDLCVLRAATPACGNVTFYAAHAYAGEAATLYRFTWEDGWMEGDFKRDDALVMHTPQGDVRYGNVALDPLKTAAHGGAGDSAGRHGSLRDPGRRITG